MPRITLHGAGDPATEISIGRSSLAILLSVDGKRTVAEIAGQHGFAATVMALAALAALGLLCAEQPPPEAGARPEESIELPGGAPGWGPDNSADAGAPVAQVPDREVSSARPRYVPGRLPPLLLGSIVVVSVALAGTRLVGSVPRSPPLPTSSGPPTAAEAVDRGAAAPVAGQNAPATASGGGGGGGGLRAAPSGPSAGLATLRTVLDEDFSDNHRGWPNDAQGTAWLSQGGYRLFARTPGQFVAVGAPAAEPLQSGQPPQWPWSDALVTAVFRRVGGQPGGGYGIIVRDQGPEPRDGVNQTGRFYVFEVSDRREIGVWRRESNRWVDILPWAPSDAVRPDLETNELAVRTDGQSVTFFVNGIEVARPRLTANVLSRGGVGVFIGGDFNEVLVERFRVQVPI